MAGARVCAHRDPIGITSDTSTHRHTPNCELRRCQLDDRYSAIFLHPHKIQCPNGWRVSEIAVTHRRLARRFQHLLEIPMALSPVATRRLALLNTHERERARTHWTLGCRLCTFSASFFLRCLCENDVVYCAASVPARRCCAEHKCVLPNNYRTKAPTLVMSNCLRFFWRTQTDSCFDRRDALKFRPQLEQAACARAAATRATRPPDNGPAHHATVSVAEDRLARTRAFGLLRIFAPEEKSK